MKKEISLIIEDPAMKQAYFEALRDVAKIHYCKSCSFLLQFGFPNTQEGICDYLICQENNLLCECEYSRIVRNLFSQKEDGIIDISPYYSKKN